jgi:hypothetical protein
MEVDWIFYALYWAVALPVGIANLLLGLHALRSDRVGWALVIFVAPLLGGILYYLTQYRPDQRAHRLAQEEDAMWKEPLPVHPVVVQKRKKQRAGET